MKIYALHGNGQDKNIYKKFISRNFHALDLPGHGQENKLEHYSVETYANYLSPKISEDCILIGHSLGGHIALELATRLQNVKGLITIAAPLVQNNNLSEAFLPNEHLAVLYTENPSIDQIQNLCKEHCTDDENTNKLVEMFQNQDPRARSSFLESIQKGVKNELEKVNSLNIPYFAIFGKNEKLVNVEYMRSLSLEYFFEIDAGHNVMLDAPRKFEKILLKMKSLL